jgi:hypothetical protein
MKLLSSTRANDTLPFPIGPILLCGVLTVWLILFVIKGLIPMVQGVTQPHPFGLIIMLCAFIFLAVLAKLGFDVMDEVFDDDDALVVRKRRREDRIALYDITTKAYFSSIPGIGQIAVLRLRRKSLTGRWLVFRAAWPRSFRQYFRSMKRLPIFKDLFERIEAAQPATT